MQHRIASLNVISDKLVVQSSRCRILAHSFIELELISFLQVTQLLINRHVQHVIIDTRIVLVRVCIGHPGRKVTTLIHQDSHRMRSFWLAVHYGKHNLFHVATASETLSDRELTICWHLNWRQLSWHLCLWLHCN